MAGSRKIHGVGAAMLLFGVACGASGNGGGAGGAAGTNTGGTTNNGGTSSGGNPGTSGGTANQGGSGNSAAGASNNGGSSAGANSAGGSSSTAGSGNTPGGGGSSNSLAPRRPQDLIACMDDDDCAPTEACHFEGGDIMPGYCSPLCADASQCPPGVSCEDGLADRNPQCEQIYDTDPASPTVCDLYVTNSDVNTCLNFTGMVTVP